MQLDTYLFFNGDCEAALALYQAAFGAQITTLVRFRDAPEGANILAEWQDKIMHGSITLGDQTLMGADIAPEQYETPKGFSISLQIKSTADAERIFQDLAKEGRVVMPLEKTFWAERFGMVVDRFGIPWLINCEG